MPEPDRRTSQPTGPASSNVIRCQIGSSYRDAVPAMIHAIVHHRCEMADVDVTRMDIVAEAMAEVVEDLQAERGPIGELALHLDFDGLDIELKPEGAPTGDKWSFDAGTIAAATVDEIVDGPDTDIVRVRHRFGSTT